MQSPKPDKKRLLTVSYLPEGGSSNKHVPFLRMRGQWLRRIGFEIGDRVEVELRDGEMVLRKQINEPGKENGNGMEGIQVTGTRGL